MAEKVIMVPKPLIQKTGPVLESEKFQESQLIEFPFKRPGPKVKGTPAGREKFQLSAEQRAILDHDAPMKIDAVAGAGKTSTLIEYAKSRPPDSRILYLAFNRTVKTEAAHRFQEVGLRNVQVETAHSLAYRDVMKGRKLKLVNQFSLPELSALLKMNLGRNDPHLQYLVTGHVQRLYAWFCNSKARQISDLDYLSQVRSRGAYELAKKFMGLIQKKARLLFSMMEAGKIPCDHNFYLKKYQLSHPRLPFDYILFDEGQDASEVMLEVFLNQAGKRIIVGDTHQQIYGWRYAVNSLEAVDFPEFSLSNSFRFSPEVARLASLVLDRKKHISNFQGRKITGRGGQAKGLGSATLARTNINLLFKAIQLVFEKKEVDGLYFEGNLNSYTYAEEGASLWDVLNLYEEAHRKIRDPLIRSMGDHHELENYARKIGDSSLLMLLEIVREYESDLPALIQGLKSRQVPESEKHTADRIFSTVHRCKGMEYDQVWIQDDFLPEEEIQKKAGLAREDAKLRANLNEEINLLYVALTRTRNELKVPDFLCPAPVQKAWNEKQGKSENEVAEIAYLQPTSV